MLDDGDGGGWAVVETLGERITLRFGIPDGLGIVDLGVICSCDRDMVILGGGGASEMPILLNEDDAAVVSGCSSVAAVQRVYP